MCIYIHTGTGFGWRPRPDRHVVMTEAVIATGFGFGSASSQSPTIRNQQRTLLVVYKQLRHGAAMANEQKEEQDTDLQIPPTRNGG